MRRDPLKRLTVQGIIAHRWLNTLESGAPPSQWTTGSRYTVHSSDETLEEEDVPETPAELREASPVDDDEELLRAADHLPQEPWSV